MANLADIAGLWILVGQDAPSMWAVMTVGVIWMVAMTAIVYVGIEASARTQYGLLAMEILTLVIFSVVALWKVGTQDIPNSITPSLEWFNPFGLSSSALAAGVILGIFIYWGWDSTVKRQRGVGRPDRGPGQGGGRLNGRPSPPSSRPRARTRAYTTRTSCRSRDRPC